LIFRVTPIVIRRPQTPAKNEFHQPISGSAHPVISGQTKGLVRGILPALSRPPATTRAVMPANPAKPDCESFAALGGSKVPYFPDLKRRAVMPLVLAAAILLVAGFSWAPASAQWSGHKIGQSHPGTKGSLVTLMGVEETVFTLTNDLRQRHGLPVLLKDSNCQVAARSHSADMLSRNYFSHTDPEGRSVQGRLPANQAIRLWGENIWTGRGYNPGQVQHLARTIMAGWMNSPGHRKNILSPSYTHLGVGVITNFQEVKATQVFIGVAASDLRTFQ
jgi:uncharacterized protein YkwD